MLIREISQCAVVLPVTNQLYFNTNRWYKEHLPRTVRMAFKRMRKNVLRLGPEATVEQMLHHPEFRLSAFRCKYLCGPKTLVAIATILTTHGYGDYVDAEGVKISSKSQFKNVVTDTLAVSVFYYEKLVGCTV